MAFKMKNPSMAKLTKAAGDNRVAMKMKMESAAKMKKEAAMKMKKESMAKLTDKASAMKLKDGGKGTTRITDKDLDRKQRIEDAANKGDKMAQIIRRYRALGAKSLSPEELKMIGKKVSPKKMKKDSAIKKPLVGDQDKLNEGLKKAIKAAPSKMKKEDSSMKMGHKSATKMGHKSATKLKKPSPAKQKMNMVKGPDGKMVPDFAVDGKGANDMKSGAKMKKPMKMKKGEPMKMKKKDSAVKMVKEVRKDFKTPKIMPTQNPPKTKKPVKPAMSEAAKKAKAEYEADLAKKKAKADAKAEAKRIEQENLAISRQRAKALGMTMREYEKHLRSKMLKSQRKRIFGF